MLAVEGIILFVILFVSQKRGMSLKERRKYTFHHFLHENL